MQMSQVSNLNRVFLHKLHHTADNFTRMIVTLGPSPKTRGASRLSLQSDFRRILAQPSPLKHQQRSDKMVPLRDYEISFLFLLLVKFHRSGKSEIYSPVQRILQCFLPSAIFSLDTENGDPLFLNVMFAQMISEL